MVVRLPFPQYLCSSCLLLYPYIDLDPNEGMLLAGSRPGRNAPAFFSFACASALAIGDSATIICIWTCHWGI
uniref:Uncharacterized protein n=1 Tax=Picea glauca TaxID=3330 RepID=A0A117NIQ5_PICGL|nr:hypothetical protein ABT39_MTgene188 [Picea glauca]QHR89325.1 hypothetical protein Q903MT_gene3346 [Picea sitchensis]